jgi:UDP-glucose 4-epimerase
MTATDQPSILVTGGAGYIGSHAVLALLDAGRRVVVLDNLVTGFADAVDPRASFVEGDIADMDLVRRVLREHRVSAILHFAGSVVVPESVSNPLKYYRNNTAASRALIEAAVDGDVRHFIFHRLPPPMASRRSCRSARTPRSARSTPMACRS